MPEFYELAARGDALGACKTAATYAALWAIGSSWATAIRSIALILFPPDERDVVIAELVSASIVTVAGILISIFIVRIKCCCDPSEACRAFLRETKKKPDIEEQDERRRDPRQPQRRALP